MKKKDGVKQRHKLLAVSKNKTAGITLVGLAVTVIILLILAGITINLTISNNGIFDHAEVAREENKRSQIREYLDLKLLDKQSEHYFETNKFIIDETRKNVVQNKRDLLNIGKQVDIKEVIEEAEEVYFYVIVDKGVYKVTLGGTKYIGQQSDKEIELQVGDIEFTYEPSKWTNENVKVGIIDNKKIEGYKLEYKLEGSTTWTTYKGKIEVDKNQSIDARLAGIMGETSTTTGNVIKIDKLLPNSFTPEVTATTNSITVTAYATDQESTKDYGSSGIDPDQEHPDAGYSFRIFNEGKWTDWTQYQYNEESKNGQYTFSNLKQNQTYDIEVKAKDKAGNETPASKVVTTGKVAIAKGNVTFSQPVWDASTHTATVAISKSNSISSNFSIQYQVNGYDDEKWVTGETATNLSLDDTVYARLWDGVNGGEYTNMKVTDDIAPSAPTITNPTSQNWTNTDFSLTLNSSDGQSGIAYYQYSYDQQTWNTYANSNANSYTTTPFSAQRNQLVYIRCIDYAENISEVSSTYIRIDKTGPNNFSIQSSSITYNSFYLVVSGVTDSASGLKEVYFVQYLDDGTTRLVGNGKRFSISNNGTINVSFTSMSAGTTYRYKCVAVDNAGNETYSSELSVTTLRYATGISLNKTSTSIYTGNYETLTATVSPTNASNKNVTWKSSNTSVATVSAGKVTAVAPGTATITVTTADGSNKSATCTVTVKQYATGISLNKTSTSIYAGNSETLTATVSPTNASNKNVTWKSSNTSVATVSGGKVTAVATGTTTITATTADGSNKSATCTVTVGTVGQTWTYDYTGSDQTFTAPIAGTYKIDLYGAQGGNYSTTYAGGKGGQATVSMKLSKGQKVTVKVGGQAQTYNGAGTGKVSNGGGATSILQDTTIAIAGGGGGATEKKAGGAGGSSITQSGTVSSTASGTAGGGGGYYAGGFGRYATNVSVTTKHTLTCASHTTKNYDYDVNDSDHRYFQQTEHTMKCNVCGTTSLRADFIEWDRSNGNNISYSLSSKYVSDSTHGGIHFQRNAQWAEVNTYTANVTKKQTVNTQSKGGSSWADTSKCTDVTYTSGAKEGNGQCKVTFSSF